MPNLVYKDLQPHQKKFYSVCVTLLDLGVTPTPKVVNQAMGWPTRRSWNGPLCRIRQQLLVKYGYHCVEHTRGLGHSVWRWEKKNDNA